MHTPSMQHSVTNVSTEKEAIHTSDECGRQVQTYVKSIAYVDEGSRGLTVALLHDLLGMFFQCFLSRI